MPLPSKRDRAQFQRRLGDWLATRLPAGAAPEVTGMHIPEGTGMSSETLIFDAAWNAPEGRRSGRHVARLSPGMDDCPIFPRYDLELQFRCLELVRAHTAVPVPRTPWLEMDEDPLGSPFFVMEWVDGRVPSDMPPYVFEGWIRDASEAERARLERNSVGILAELHALDLGSVEVGFLERPEFGAGALEQHLGYQRHYYDWAREGRSFPILERTFEWLDARRPADEPDPVLNWGDSRIGNVLYRGFEPVAVLDWEMAALGAPEADLAWMLFMHAFFADLAAQMGLPGIPGFLQRDSVVANYQELSGRSVRDLAYYEVFTALRYGIISIRTSLRQIVHGEMEEPDDPDEMIMIRGLMERMLSGDYWGD